MNIKNRTYRGFSLIELLVVLGIVAIITAILLPVFASARRKAQMTECASNLHQVALALKMYANDYSGDYPPDDPNLAHNPHLVWTLLTPYTHNAEVFHCPDALGDAGRGYSYEYGSAPYFHDPSFTLKAPLPGSGTVVAECDQHTQRMGDGWALDAGGHEIGPVIVVREDGSTGMVQGSQIEGWIYHQGRWRLRGNTTPQPGDRVHVRFPGEEWSPQD